LIFTEIIKKLYTFVSELTGKNTDNPMPEGESDTAIAENFADHFLDKINKIRDALASFEKFTPNTRKYHVSVCSRSYSKMK